MNPNISQDFSGIASMNISQENPQPNFTRDSMQSAQMYKLIDQEALEQKAFDQKMGQMSVASLEELK